MKSIARTATLSTKGQLVIPQDVRDKLKWATGTSLWVKITGKDKCELIKIEEPK